MKELETFPGKTYSVHTMKGCTIIEPDGWQKTIEAPDGYFDAHFGSVVIEGDDEASIKEVFKVAPYQKLRLLGVVGGNGGLPAGYKRVEYLESTGTQYIDTGFIPQIEPLFIKCKISLEERASGWMPFAGIQNPAYWRSFGKDESGSRINVLGRHWVLYNFVIEIGDAIECQIEDLWESATVKINETEISRFGSWNTYEYSEASTLSYVIFGAKRQNGVFCKKWKSYNFSMESEEKIVDYIPALDPTGAPCMFDLVSRKPFYNAGTGDFLYPTERTTYALRRVLPDWGKLTEHGLRRLYHAPEGYTGELVDYALENGYKPIIEPEQPTEGYWSPRWRENEDEIVLEWVETEPLMDEFGLPDETFTETE